MDGGAVAVDIADATRPTEIFVYRGLRVSGEKEEE
jgi:hypothetical protein